MGCFASQPPDKPREAEWVHLIEALWSLECRHLLGEVTAPKYQQQRGALLETREIEAWAAGGYLKRFVRGKD